MIATPPVRRVDLTGVIDMVVAVTFTGSFVVGFGAAIAGTLSGALAAAIGGRWGATASLVAGAVGTGLVAGAVAGTMIGPRRDWRIVLACFAATAVGAFLVADAVPGGREWRMLRWAVPAAGFGVAFGGLCDPIRFADDFGLDADNPWFLVRIGQGVAAVVKAISVGRAGAVLAGALSSALGGLGVGLLLAGVGRDELLELTHGYWRTPLASAGLAAAAGAANGWWTWGRALRLAATDDPDVERTGDIDTDPPRGSILPAVDSVTFDLTGCDLREQSETHRGWMNAAGVAHVLRFHSKPPDWPFDLTDPAGARAFFRFGATNNGGVLLDMDVTAADGVEALRGLFKYRSPVPDSLAMMYVGILWLPFRDCVYQINVESMEYGTTGIREAAVMVLLGDAWPTPPQDEIPVIESLEQLAALRRSAPVRQLPSDDPKYDGSFPQHPLSLVRARLAEVVATLRVSPEVRALKPYRAQRGWPWDR